MPENIGRGADAPQSEGGNMFEVEAEVLIKHEGHAVAVRVSTDEDGEQFPTIDCDTCGEYIIE
jgi:formylmethanofuran dehydrogenase subunit E